MFHVNHTQPVATAEIKGRKGYESIHDYINWNDYFVRNPVDINELIPGLTELYFNDKAFAHMNNENSRPYKKFKKLLDKYDLEYDLIRYKCIEVWEE